MGSSLLNRGATWKEDQRPCALDPQDEFRYEVPNSISRRAARSGQPWKGYNMPFEHSIDEKHRLLVIRGSGAGSLEETEDSVGRALRSIGNGEIPPDYGVLLAVDDVEWAPTAEDLVKITHFIALFQGRLRGPIAIVASAVGKLTPAHLVAAYSAGPSGAVQAFTNESEARAWLLARRAS